MGAGTGARTGAGTGAWVGMGAGARTGAGMGAGRMNGGGGEGTCLVRKTSLTAVGRTVGVGVGVGFGGGGGLDACIGALPSLTMIVHISLRR